MKTLIKIFSSIELYSVADLAYLICALALYSFLFLEFIL